MIIKNMRLSGIVEKGWGKEIIFATGDLYCGKLMIFDNENSKFSMHFHKEKDESWYVLKGSFIIRWIDTKTAEIREEILKESDTWHNPPHLPHQLIAMTAGSTIIEVSTADSVEDNFRIFPGDSQR
jgi:mannose-6-phosphate isomerase-like protein (cupin superfamily)